MIYKCLDNKTSGSAVKSEIMSNQELAREFYESKIKKIKKRKRHSSFISNNWGSNLADIQLISKFSNEFQYSSRVIDIYSKHAWFKCMAYNYK